MRNIKTVFRGFCQKARASSVGVAISCHNAGLPGGCGAAENCPGCQLRRFLMGDYYPLAVQSRDLGAWEAWQFHEPATGEGFVQAFRLESGETSRGFALKGLDPRKNYRLTNPYTGRTMTATGEKLMHEGIRFQPGPVK